VEDGVAVVADRVGGDTMWLAKREESESNTVAVIRVRIDLIRLDPTVETDPLTAS
jgi:hypothetical protein